MHRGLIQIEHDGKTCHEEEEEYHPELFHALVAAESLPEKAEQTEEERQHIEHVVSLILLQFVGQLFLVAIYGIVDEGDTSEPVAVFLLTIALIAVLTAGKVPHEIAPVHEVDLIGYEEVQIVPLRGHLAILEVATRSGIVDITELDVSSQPVVVSLRMCAGIHTWEEHLHARRILQRFETLNIFISVGFVSLCLLFAVVLRCGIINGLSVGIKVGLRSESLAEEERCLAILVTTEVATQREDVLGRVLIHWWIGNGANHDDSIRTVANHQHEHTEEARVENALAQQHLSVLSLHVEQEVERS